MTIHEYIVTRLNDGIRRSVWSERPKDDLLPIPIARALAEMLSADSLNTAHVSGDRVIVTIHATGTMRSTSSLKKEQA